MSKRLALSIGGARELLKRVNWDAVKPDRMEGALAALTARSVALSLRLIQGAAASDDDVAAHELAAVLAEPPPPTHTTDGDLVGAFEKLVDEPLVQSTAYEKIAAQRTARSYWAVGSCLEARLTAHPPLFRIQFHLRAPNSGVYDIEVWTSGGWAPLVCRTRIAAIDDAARNAFYDDMNALSLAAKRGWARAGN